MKDVYHIKFNYIYASWFHAFLFQTAEQLRKHALLPSDTILIHDCHTFNHYLFSNVFLSLTVGQNTMFVYLCKLPLYSYTSKDSLAKWPRVFAQPRVKWHQTENVTHYRCGIWRTWPPPFQLIYVTQGNLYQPSWVDARGPTCYSISLLRQSKGPTQNFLAASTQQPVILLTQATIPPNARIQSIDYSAWGNWCKEINSCWTKKKGRWTAQSYSSLFLNKLVFSIALASKAPRHGCLCYSAT